MTDKSAEMEERLERYQEDLPADRDKIWALLQDYSHIAPADIEQHLRSVRDRAWKIFPYTCIGAWRFLDLCVAALPVYPSVVARLTHSEERLLDIGCCFGQVLRQLVSDGVPASRLVGTDLRQEFIDLGFDLFRDRETFAGQFVAGDMLADDLSLQKLNGTINIIHTSSFFHLFSWEDQVRVGRRMVQFFDSNPSSTPLIFGRQIGCPIPPTREELAARGEYRFHHNPATLQKLWDEIGLATNTRWTVDAQLVAEDELRPAGDFVKRRSGGRHHMIVFAISLQK